MLVKFQGVWMGQAIYVNPSHVKTLRPVVQRELVKVGVVLDQYKVFPVAGHTLIEYSAANAEDCLTDAVIGTIDEVADKLNGNPWLDIESAPRDIDSRQQILVRSYTRRRFIAVWAADEDGGEGWVIDGLSSEGEMLPEGYITHWMPMEGGS